jgi:hypothetical protein
MLTVRPRLLGCSLRSASFQIGPKMDPHRCYPGSCMHRAGPPFGDRRRGVDPDNQPNVHNPAPT